MEEAQLEESQVSVCADVGRLAGDVWQYLDRNGETTTLRLRSAIKVSQSLLFLSLGWLAREGKIEVVAEDRGYRVSLKR